MKLPFPRITITSAITFTLVSLIIPSIGGQQILAQSPFLVAQEDSNDGYVPRDRGRRSQRTDGGGRGPESCPPLEQLGRPPLTALVPLAKTTSDPLLDKEEPTLGGTFESHPTFWFYIPYDSPTSNNRTLKAKFTVQDVNREQYIYDNKFISIDLSKTPGIISIRPPVSVKPLEEGKQYYWHFTIICDLNDPANNPDVDGWIQRDALSSEDRAKLEGATVQQKLDFYFSRSIWHEALTLLAESRRDRANYTTLKPYWNNLLQDQVLSRIAEQPIVQCCSADADVANPLQNPASGY
jgi:hypothetical protein